MKCHDCAKFLTMVNAHAFQIHKAVIDYKRNKNEVNIFKLEHHSMEIRVQMDKIDKKLAERLVVKENQ